MKILSNLNPSFLLRLDTAGHYFVLADGQETGATDILSCAKHFETYEAADAMCQRYRRKRFVAAVVTDSSGQVITHESLKRIKEIV